ncbi:DUF47 domain-containing protein [Aminipila sp.]|jgi:hypothetical protein|uniref:DUF47 domain-containing protein n=1 Tax=Aminipila sp. TaxID=2060095 RepID=UPI001D350478|nr:DUF47 family protein [Aminipila sp.]MBE6033809.1 DUF47 domain-containing protein [Clostridiales bacterium]
MLRAKKKEDIFYHLFIEYAQKIVKSGEAFVDLVKNYENVEDKIAAIKVFETECDMEAHKILKALNGSFVTPFDREDIYSVTKEMDDIVDSLEEVANRFLVFNVQAVKQEAVYMADLIMQSIRELEVLFKHLSEMKKNGIVREQIIEVNRIENEGDVIYRKALSKLFREEKDPIELIKWKHLFEELEASLDSCENVANILEGVVMKYA